MKIVYTEEEILVATRTLAAEINKDYKGQQIHFVGVLKGAFIFLADLIRHVAVPCSVDFVRMSSYGSATASSGVVTEVMGLSDPVADRHVIVVEEIVDSGLTLSKLLDHIDALGPASLKVCTLVDKVGRRQVSVPVAYRGLVCEDGFLVGYGLDFDERLRNLSAIHEVDDET